MVINARLRRLEDEVGRAQSRPRRCPVCDDGAKLAHRAVYPGFPDRGQRGPTCDACGREALEFTLVRGIDPAAL